MNAATTSAPGRASKRKFVLWLVLAAVIFWLDQWSKEWILAHYQLGEYTTITGFFNIVRAHNPGAAFSFLASAGGWQRWLFTGIGVVVTAVITWQLYRHSHKSLFCLALTCIMGGAIGNVVDRMRHGYVVDMLDFHWMGSHFPAFNLADSAICLGAFLLILDELLRMRRGEKG
ncbi:MAG: signal peptidase II [Comamonas sp.]